ncbi:MAG: hypothetical protein FWE91_03075 [Defluviitaleaceae bacterium]|nr:hypothetical protein [Defluviitaleaceae bacterium]MCL2835913.1 hypothetical protein [Defluviitaleaceae bacterium]
MMKKRNPARMRYTADSRSAWLCYFSILCCIAYFIAVYSSNTIAPDVRMGVDVVANIVFMLAIFWASEMVKVYNRKWSVALAGFGLVQIGRVFWLPVHYNELEQLVDGSYVFVCATLAASGVFLLLAAALSFSNSTLLKKYLDSQSM